METKSIVTRLFIVSEWITRIAFLNLIWLLFNLPIFYLSFHLFVSTLPQQLLAIVSLIAVLSPVLLFPSTTALFGVARKWVQGELGVKLLPSFWKFYKENYLRSLLGGIAFTIVWLFLILDFYYFSTIKSPIYYLFLVVALFMVVITINFFSLSVHYEGTLFQTMKNAFLLTLGRPVHTLGIAFISIACFYISFNLLPFLLFLGLGSLCAYGSFFIFHRGVTPAA